MSTPILAPSLESSIIQAQEEEIKQLWAMIETIQRDLAFHARRLKTLEEGPKKTSHKAPIHLDAMYRSLIESGQRGMTCNQIATCLHITSRRVRQLKPQIEEDPRFIIVRHPTRTNSFIICLRKPLK